MKKIQKKSHEREDICVPRHRILLIFITFNFNFVALYEVCFQNYFANRSIKLESFTRHLHATFTSMLHQIYRTTLTFSSSLHILCNMVTHIVISTYNLNLFSRPGFESRGSGPPNTKTKKKYLLMLYIFL